jgi:hypothetical protein
LQKSLKENLENKHYSALFRLFAPSAATITVSSNFYATTPFTGKIECPMAKVSFQLSPIDHGVP